MMMSVQMSNRIPMKNSRNCPPTLRLGKLPTLNRNNSHLLKASSRSITTRRMTNTFHNGRSLLDNIL